MDKNFHILTFILCISLLSAQDKVKQFDLDYSGKKIDNSLYTSIKLLDSREDTSNMGIVRIGMLNKEAVVLPNGSFLIQLNNLLSKINGVGAQKKELLFQLRRLKFVEKAEGGKEFGYCFFRANLFTGIQSEYKLISSIDTFLVVEAKDVTKPLLEEANKTIGIFLRRALTKNFSYGSVLSLNEIVKIDSIEKLNIRVYNVSEYVDGVYTNFEAFKNQTPNYALFSITFEDGEITELKAKSRKGKVKRMKSDNVYAIVNKGKPYISAEFGYYPLVKNNNDFYFIGDDKINYLKDQVVKSNSFFNPTEYVYSPFPLTSTYEIKIDHVNGKFMRVKEIKGTN